MTGKYLGLLVGTWMFGSIWGAECRYDQDAAMVGEVILDTSIEFQMQWKVDAKRVTIALSANRTQGWLGLGLAESTTGSMIGADVVVVGRDGDKAFVQDRHVPWSGFPFAPYGSTFKFPNASGNGFEEVETSPSLFPALDSSNDGCEDWVLEEFSSTEECVVYVVSRALKTEDANDREIVIGESQPVIWAHGEAGNVAYHSANRGTLAIDFSKQEAENNAPEVSCPDSDCTTVDIVMQSYEIQAQETSYVCQSFTAPATQDMHAIAFYPLVEIKQVHHILLHSCSSDTFFAQHVTPNFCGGGGVGISPLGTRCTTLLFGWGVGGKALVLPPEAGVRVGPSANQFLMIEVHYNNAALESGVVDASSGVRMIMTPNLRTHDAAVLVTGDPSLGFDDLPAGKKDVHRQGECAQECTGQAIPESESITIFGAFPHMHAFGKEIFFNVYDKAMQFKSSLGKPADFWNFEFQGFSTLKEFVKVSSRDTIFTHCRYDTSKWSKGPIKFGEGSLDEMCMGFLMYYPVKYVKDRPWTLCGTALGVERGVAQNGFSGQVAGLGGMEAAIFRWNPDLRSVGFAHLCNNKPNATFKRPVNVANLLTVELPANRPDPRVYNTVSGTFDHLVDFAGSGPSTCSSGSGTGTGAGAGAGSDTNWYSQPVFLASVSAGAAALLLAAALLVVYKKKKTASGGAGHSQAALTVKDASGI